MGRNRKEERNAHQDFWFIVDLQTMKISNKPVVQKIIQECINHGIKNVVFSPRINFPKPVLWPLPPLVELRCQNLPLAFPLFKIINYGYLSRILKLGLELHMPSDKLCTFFMQDLIQFYETIYSIHENRSPYGSKFVIFISGCWKKKSDQMCSSYFLPISTLQIAMHLLP